MGEQPSPIKIYYSLNMVETFLNDSFYEDIEHSPSAFINLIW